MTLTATLFLVTMSGVILSVFGLAVNSFIPLLKEPDRRLPLEKLLDNHAYRPGRFLNGRVP